MNAGKASWVQWRGGRHASVCFDTKIHPTIRDLCCRKKFDVSS